MRILLLILVLAFVAFVVGSTRQMTMKTLLRTAAALSFLFCAAGGGWILSQALAQPHEDAFMVGAVGLFLVGIAFFLGGILVVAAERIGQKDESR
jgi:hypothetical protein